MELYAEETIYTEVKRSQTACLGKWKEVWNGWWSIIKYVPKSHEKEDREERKGQIIKKYFFLC